MKRNTFVIVIFFVALSACSKSSSTPDYFKFILGDVTYSFDSVYAWADTSVDDLAVTSLYASDTKTGSSARLDLQSNSNKIEGRYVRDQTSGSPIIIGFTIHIVSGSNSYSYSVQTGPFSVMVHDMGNYYLTGTFSGNTAEQVPAQTVAITNGEFATSFKYRSLLSGKS